uniref:Serine/threonine-protein kinase Nek9 n=1 Tax=Anthurium amnicola TaxID=1678845 RepID=A0A1D1XCG1_9ARAE
MATARLLILRRVPLPRPHHPQNPNSSCPVPLQWRRSLWSMQKDPALEAALSRNRRWVVNNQIKNLLLRCPGGAATVRSLQRRFKTLDLRGRALNWLRKYPCCFETFPDPAGTGEVHYRLSKRMAALVEEEEAAREAAEPAMARRLAKVLMLSRGRRLNVVKLNELKRGFGLPDDYLLRVVPRYPEVFRIVNPSGRRNSMEIELVRWDADLAVSAVEAAAAERRAAPRFVCSLPPSWAKSRARFDEFNEGTPYVSPYSEEQMGSEKRAVGMVHELLSLTLWKKLSIVKLGHFRREFALPEKVNLLLLRHPCIFYVSNRYKIYTVVLREGYNGSDLVNMDPLVAVKEKLGELMQEGLHEYNRRRHLVNLEKRRKKGEVAVRVERGRVEEEAPEQDGVYKSEERRRFYKALFDDFP